MKIFISIPMTSKSTTQVDQEMGKVYKYIKEKLPQAELIDSVIDWEDKDIALKGDDIACWYLAKSIELMTQADLVFFVNNWRSFRGCFIERQVAEAYNKFCVEIQVPL